MVNTAKISRLDKLSSYSHVVISTANSSTIIYIVVSSGQYVRQEKDFFCAKNAHFNENASYDGTAISFNCRER